MKNEERRMYTLEAKALAEEQKRLNPDCWKRKRTNSVCVRHDCFSVILCACWHVRACKDLTHHYYYTAVVPQPISRACLENHLWQVSN